MFSMRPASWCTTVTPSGDPPTSHVVMRDLQRINRELGITTIVNLHFLDLARVYAERIIGLRGGELVFDGPGSAADENVFRDIYGRSLTADDILQPAAPVDVHESLAGLSSDSE